MVVAVNQYNLQSASVSVRNSEWEVDFNLICTWNTAQTQPHWQGYRYHNM